MIMLESRLTTPILLLTFNRPDNTQLVFNEIRKARPAQLYVATDKPREDHPDDIEKCKKVMEVIGQVDWDCKVFILSRTEHVGPKIGTSSAINWFFDQVEGGIILEDDCVPDQSFFPFCQEMLEKYREDERVMMITGTNYLFLKYEMPETYFFSKYYPQWGWATWRRAWILYDIHMRNWPQYRDSSQLSWIYSDKRLIDWYTFMFQNGSDESSVLFASWDIPWWFTCIFQNGLCIVPKYNLISNVGLFGYYSDGSCTYTEWDRMPTRSIDTDNIIHPATVIENGTFDRITIERVLGKQYSPLNRFIYHIICFRNRIIKIFSRR